MNADNKIRKVAVLIASIDHHTADALLDQMPADQAALVRQAVMNLSDVELAEADEVIAEFVQGRATRPPGDPSTITPLAAPGGPVPPATVQPPPECATPATRPARLEQVDVPTLSRRLAQERPRLAGAIVGRLSPTRAAELLQHLPHDFQIEVLRCIAGNEVVDEELVGEIEAELTREIEAGRAGSASHAAGVSTVEAILRAVDADHRRHLVGRLASGDEHLAKRLDSAGLATERPRTGPAQLRLTHESLDFDEASDAKRAARPDVEFDELSQLDDRSLARVFREADWTTLMLALTGADPALIDRLARQLPPRAARMLRQRVEMPGLLRIRDVEVAQQEIACLIAELAAQGRIRLPRRRGFTIAA